MASTEDTSGLPLIMCLTTSWQSGGNSHLLHETSQDHAEAAAVDISETLMIGH